MSKTCVYCNSADNLNTSFNITIDDGTKVVVFICDEHAEEASVKTAKEAYLVKKTQIDALLAQAAALGLKLVEGGNGLAVFQNEAPAKEKPLLKPQTTKKEVIIEDDGDYIPTDIVDRKQIAMPTIVSNSAGAESYAPSDLNAIRSELPEGALKGQAKIGVFEGRQGVPIALVRQRRDGLGTTNVQIIKKENDQTLQERFKRMASMEDTPDFAKSGYHKSFTDCGLCRGTGNIRNGKSMVICPKCQGSGIINLS